MVKQAPWAAIDNQDQHHQRWFIRRVRVIAPSPTVSRTLGASDTTTESSSYVSLYESINSTTPSVVIVERPHVVIDLTTDQPFEIIDLTGDSE